jgi:leader peptidase (prepilin peptidase)/N-methyltransferase
MQTMVIIAAFVLGAVFGSFLNVCVTRLPLGESVNGRSRCRDCGKKIRWYDNVPLVSWIALRGKCRECGERIGARYFLVELGLALLWVACALVFGIEWAGASAAVFCFLMLGLLVTDAETMLLPNAMTLPGIVLGVAFSVVAAGAGERLRALYLSAGAAAIGAALLLLIYGMYWLVRRRAGLGLGDVKLLAAIGAFLGISRMLFSFVAGTIATAAAAILWIAVRPKREQGEDIPLLSLPFPYGSFLAGAGLIALFFGDRVVAWYLSFFR